MKKNIFFAFVAFLALAVGAWGLYYLGFSTTSPSPDSKDVATSKKTSAKNQICAGHKIPEKDCFICHPELMTEKGWCKGHSVPEAVCTRCHPDLIPAFKATNDWCAGHNLPESQCEACNPGTLAQFQKYKGSKKTSHQRQANSLNELLPRKKRSPSKSCDTEELKIRFDSPQIAKKAGIKTQKVKTKNIHPQMEAPVVMAYNRQRYSRLSPRVSGVIKTVHVEPGQKVEKGEVLATLDSVPLGSAKSDYLQARSMLQLWQKNFQREKKLYADKITTERELLEVETRLAQSKIKVKQARQKLRVLGLSEEEIQEVAHGGDTSPLFSLQAPFKGVIVKFQAVRGEMARPHEILFSVADTSQMWAEIDIFQKNIRHLQKGQVVHLRFSEFPGRKFAGNITWISTELDSKTRTLKVRATIPNPEGILKARLYGKAKIFLAPRSTQVVVPKESVQWEGCCNLVFVKKGPALFRPRKVKLGYEGETFYVVKRGLAKGEEIAVEGSFLLKTEVLKGSIGAGCCEVE